MNSKEVIGRYTYYHLAREVDGKVLGYSVVAPPEYTRQQIAISLRAARRKLAEAATNARR